MANQSGLMDKWAATSFKIKIDFVSCQVAFGVSVAVGMSAVELSHLLRLKVHNKKKKFSTWIFPYAAPAS